MTLTEITEATCGVVLHGDNPHSAFVCDWTGIKGVPMLYAGDLHDKPVDLSRMYPVSRTCLSEDARVYMRMLTYKDEEFKEGTYIKDVFFMPATNTDPEVWVITFRNRYPEGSLAAITRRPAGIIYIGSIIYSQLIESIYAVRWQDYAGFPDQRGDTFVSLPLNERPIPISVADVPETILGKVEPVAWYEQVKNDENHQEVILDGVWKSVEASGSMEHTMYFFTFKNWD